MTTLEIKDAKSELIKRNLQIVELCQAEKRELTEDEQKEYDENKDKIKDLDEEQKNLEKELEKEPEEKSDCSKDKNNRNIQMNKSLVQEIRNAITSDSKTFTLKTEKRAQTVAGIAATGTEGTEGYTPAQATTIVEDEVQSILEPLYANSVLHNIGARFYTGLPMGNIVVPKMSKGTCDWADEMAQAGESTNKFETITLSPNRLCAYTVISKQVLAQDTVGVEAAIRRDIVNALNDKLEATILGAGAKGDNKPAGIFNGKELTSVSTFANVCDLEATVEENNYQGSMIYLASPKAKAKFRQMAKSAKSTELVYENGTVDGTPLTVTSNVPQNKFVFGNFNDLCIGVWDNIEVTVDPYTMADKAAIKLVINAYFDAKLARPEGLVFGTVA